ncbi:MAG TPA: hypothetical protein VEB42_11130, partial [Chitinophagaceae bacterium]|nr:hypothetical protein [Chitinophagaceae bacterium]
MHKIGSLLLSIGVILTFSGCGNASSAKQEGTQQESTQQESTQQEGTPVETKQPNSNYKPAFKGQT